MKEPTKSEIAKAIIALLELEGKQGWIITPQLRKAIKDCIDDLRFYYQFAHNDKKEGHIPSLKDSSLSTSK